MKVDDTNRSWALSGDAKAAVGERSESGARKRRKDEVRTRGQRLALCGFEGVETPEKFPVTIA